MHNLVHELFERWLRAESEKKNWRFYAEDLSRIKGHDVKIKLNKMYEKKTMLNIRFSLFLSNLL